MSGRPMLLNGPRIQTDSYLLGEHELYCCGTWKSRSCPDCESRNLVSALAFRFVSAKIEEDAVVPAFRRVDRAGCVTLP